MNGIPGATPTAVSRLVLLLLLAGCAGGTAATGTDDLVASTETRVHYPAGWGHRITLRCSGDWNRTIETMWTADDVWVASVPAGSTCKPLLDDTTWSIGPNYPTGDVWPHFWHTAGAVARTEIGGRGVWLYRPPSYDENPRQTYPVVYMHDGQNLFDDRASFGGVSWNVGGAMDDGIERGSIAEALVVGVENTGARMDEYTPVPDPEYGGGKAADYLALLVDVVKPGIDATGRTKADAAHTAIVGSSLGGLVSVWAGLARPDVFGLVGALSPSTWWADTWLVGQSEAATPRIARLYLDSGNAGTSGDDVTNTTRLAAVWETKPVLLRHVVQDGASHSEVWWRERIGGALGFLLQ